MKRNCSHCGLNLLEMYVSLYGKTYHMDPVNGAQVESFTVDADGSLQMTIKCPFCHTAMIEFLPTAEERQAAMDQYKVEHPLWVETVDLALTIPQFVEALKESAVVTEPVKEV